MQDKEKIIINNHIQGDPLSEENLDKTLNFLNKIRLLFGQSKTIWLYTGFTWEQIMYPVITDDFNTQRDELLNKRKEIVKIIDVLVDGRYVEALKDISLKWRGSSNQKIWKNNNGIWGNITDNI